MRILVYFSKPKGGPRAQKGWETRLSGILSAISTTPIPVAARSKTQVCGRSTAGVVGSNPTGGHGCLSVVGVVCCHVEVFATG